ncbi:hypothetical protein HGM15179_021879, partial [Zosterops borbonicus]
TRGEVRLQRGVQVHPAAHLLQHRLRGGAAPQLLGPVDVHLQDEALECHHHLHGQPGPVGHALRPVPAHPGLLLRRPQQLALRDGALQNGEVPLLRQPLQQHPLPHLHQRAPLHGHLPPHPLPQVGEDQAGPHHLRGLLARGHHLPHPQPRLRHHQHQGQQHAVPRHHPARGVRPLRALQLLRHGPALRGALPGHRRVLLPDGQAALQAQLPQPRPPDALLQEALHQDDHRGAHCLCHLLRALPHHPHPLLHLPILPGRLPDPQHHQLHLQDHQAPGQHQQLPGPHPVLHGRGQVPGP